MSDRTVTGACNCEGVAFELTGPMHGIFMCHCSICRRWTGANGIPVVLVDHEGFRWVRGEEQVAVWRKPGHDWTSAFCRVCGSSLPVANDEERMAVPAGLLSEDGAPWVVRHHIWVDSRASWDQIGDPGHQHPREFRGMAPYTAK